MFDEFQRKLDYFANPKTGIYAELAILTKKADAAHRRIDIIEKKKEMRVSLYTKILIAVIASISSILLMLLVDYFK